MARLIFKVWEAREERTITASLVKDSYSPSHNIFTGNLDTPFGNIFNGLA
jgi:hypothetical protein